MGIDWNFIGKLEGHRVLTGYVPATDISKSGVTVATGVDLGQRNAADIAALSSALQAKLQPYLGLKGLAASQFLKRQPLTLTSPECDTLDAFVQEGTMAPMRTHFKQAAGTEFTALPDAVQTVLASVTFQYGSPWARTPKFWGMAVQKDFHGMVLCLKDFGDAYTTRRMKEAVYLDNWLNPGTKTIQV